MLKLNNNKAQAVVELAIFGAILIYLIGTIIRTAMGNSLTQNENFKAMRMALLDSWNGSIQGNISRNSASIVIVEDRLSPDFNKYGPLERTPYIASGSGTFSYELLYPLTPGQDNMQAQMPVMDIYINGQHFPLTSAAYVTRTLPNPSDGNGIYPNGPNCPMGNTHAPIIKQTLSPSECVENQCLRYRREWVGGNYFSNQFDNVISPVVVLDGQDESGVLCSSLTAATTAETTKLQNSCQADANSRDILTMLAENPNAMIDGLNTCSDKSTCGAITPGKCADGSACGYYEGTLDSGAFPSLWSNFVSRYSGEYSTYFPPLVNPTGVIPPPYTQAQIAARQSQSTPAAIAAQLAKIKAILDTAPSYAYKLFYTIVANMIIPGAAQATPVYSVDPPSCASHPCKNQELSTDRCLTDANGTMCNTGTQNGDLMFDLQRNNIAANTVPSGLRPYLAWQWAATAGTTAGMIGINTSNNEFPQYDIDGRLKEVTIYGISCCGTYTQTVNGKTVTISTGEPTVSYEDLQGGDIDVGWDTNSCGPKPGLQSDAQIYTFTQNGTYLQIKDGQLLNPETGQVVRSQSKRDTIDIIQREVQLSNNTGRFCNGSTPLATVANDGVTPNPVEVCIDASDSVDNCFNSEMNIKSTCFDEHNDMLFVRSRLQDLRGHLWMTATSGQLKVQQ